MERTEVRNRLSMRDKALSRTDVIARAKAMGLRDYRDRVVLAIQNDDLQPEMGNLFSRADVDLWIDEELAVDRYEDEVMISLQQARALAKESRLEDYNAAVLNAITRMEIPGVEYRRNQPRIPVQAFEAWLEDQEITSSIQPELTSPPHYFDPSTGVVFSEALRIYLLPALVILLALSVLGMGFRLNY